MKTSLIHVMPTITTYDHIHQTCYKETYLNPTLSEAESRHVLVVSCLFHVDTDTPQKPLLAHTNSNMIITLKDDFGDNP